jgi:hypothetical protein
VGYSNLYDVGALDDIRHGIELNSDAGRGSRVISHYYSLPITAGGTIWGLPVHVSFEFYRTLDPTGTNDH